MLKKGTEVGQKGKHDEILFKKKLNERMKLCVKQPWAIKMTSKKRVIITAFLTLCFCLLSFL